MDAFRDTLFPKRPNFCEQQDPYADDWGRMGASYISNLQRNLRGYYAQTMSLDREMARLLQTLDELQLTEDTIVVFTSDHGEMFGSQGRRAKNIFYEEAARVPFVARWNKHIPAGTVSDACLNSVDVMPTLLALMELPTPKTAEGMDLSHLALGRPGPEPDAAYMQSLAPTANFADGHEWRALRDRQYTYAIYRRDGRELLFDHQADPFQQKDLSTDAAHAATLAHYREKLNAWMKERNDTFESASWYRDHWTKDRNCVNSATGVTQDLVRLREIIREHFPR
jgi:arylsulfatase A-like enzyme